MKIHHLQWLLALTASLTASARPPQAPPADHRPPPPVPPLFAMFDTNHDQVLSAQEITAASKIVAALDKNGDGQITPEEARPPRDDDGGKRQPPDGPPPGGRPVPPLLQALDTDADGTLSAAELAAAPDSLKALDVDGDGALSHEELRPVGPPPKEGGPEVE